MRSYIEEIDYGGYSTEDDYVLADGSVGCSLPDLRYTLAFALGALRRQQVTT